MTTDLVSLATTEDLLSGVTIAWVFREMTGLVRSGVTTVTACLATTGWVRCGVTTASDFLETIEREPGGPTIGWDYQATTGNCFPKVFILF